MAGERQITGYQAFCASHLVSEPVRTYEPFDPNVPYNNADPRPTGAGAYNAARGDRPALFCLGQFPERKHEVVILEEAA